MASPSAPTTSSTAGNGRPFILAEIDRERALLLSSPTWASSRGNVGRVEVAFSQELEASVWRDGVVDIAFSRDTCLEHEPRTVAELVNELDSSSIGYRTDRHPFENELVRRAFSHALDRDRLFGNADSAGRPAGRGGLLPPAMPGRSHRISPPFDLELAKRLVAEARYPDAKGLPE